MKNRYLLLLIIFVSNTLKAQWVPIPQAFADYIKAEISASAINGNLLDTTNAGILGVSSIQTFVGFDAVTNATGFQYFDNLRDLMIMGKSLKIIGSLPNDIKTLEISGAYNSTILDSITMFPSNLSELRLDDYIGTAPLPAFSPNLKKLRMRWYESSNPIPYLPNSLTEIDFQYSAISDFPNMPSSLVSLDISYNRSYLSSLPNFGPNIKEFLAIKGWIGQIGAFPQQMDHINLLSSFVSSLTNLPQYIGYLVLAHSTELSYTQTSDIYAGTIVADYCPGVNIQSFADHTRQDFISNYGPLSFYARGNGLTSIPQFKAYIKMLDLSFNPIANITPQLPVADSILGQFYPFETLEKLYLDSCVLTYLTSDLIYGRPQQVSLEVLSLSGNNFNFINVDSLPSVSTLLRLDSSNIYVLEGNGFNTQTISLLDNHLYCIPPLLNTVTNLNLSGNYISCLPNIPSGLQVDIPVSVCQPGNGANCKNYAKVTGTLFNDMNNDGTRSNGELGIKNKLVKLDSLGAICKTDTSGRFQFYCPSGRSYFLKVFTAMYTSISTPSDSLIIPHLNFGEIDSLRDIGLHTPPDINDIEITVTAVTEARPGFQVRYNITATNVGTSLQSGKVIFHFNPILLFDIATGGGMKLGDSVVWNFNGLIPGEIRSYDIDFLLPNTINLGTIISGVALANGNSPDTTMFNNRDTITFTTIGSYDPNDKTAYPGTVLTKEEMLSGEGIDYVVRFQNTGTASAINVRVEDTISLLMEAATIRMIASSHVNDWRIDSGNILKVFFNNINLPDSGANELLSHGFFRYSIKPKAGTSIGDSIKNTALIYFDFNAPIVTNTVKTDVTTLFATPIAPQTLCEGQQLTLSFTDNPAISKIEWLRNDTLLAQTGSSFNIASISNRDQGLYNVRITLHNDGVFHSPKAQIGITPTVEPKVLIAHASPALCAGLPASFSAHPTNGGANPSYQWFLNGASMPGDSALFTITHLRDSDMVFTVMTSSLSCVTKPMDTSNIRIVEADTLVTPFVQLLTDSASVCQGSSALFTAISQHQGGAPTYTWYVNGIPQSGGGNTFNSNTLSSTDKVSVVMHSSMECVSHAEDTSTEISPPILEFVSPAVTILPGNFFCSGIGTLASVSINQGNAPAYQWSINGQLVPGAVSSSFSVDSLHQGDSIGVVMTSNRPCLITPAASAFQFVNIQPSTDISLTGIGQTPHYYSCYGEPKVFTVLGDDFGYMPLYTWFLNGKEVASGIDLNSIQMDTLNPGDRVSVLAGSGAQQCINDTSYSIAVAIFAPVLKPVIALSGNTLSTDSNMRTQWLQGGNPITGATSHVYTVKANDTYSVEITDIHGCTAVSDEMPVVVLGLAANAATAVRVFPNPFTSVLTLHLDAYDGSGGWGFSLMNVSGQIVQQQQVSQSITALQLEQLPAGVYMLHVQSANGNKAFRLVKY